MSRGPSDTAWCICRPATVRVSSAKTSFRASSRLVRRELWLKPRAITTRAAQATRPINLRVGVGQKDECGLEQGDRKWASHRHVSGSPAHVSGSAEHRMPRRAGCAVQADGASRVAGAHETAQGDPTRGWHWLAADPHATQRRTCLSCFALRTARCRSTSAAAAWSARANRPTGATRACPTGCGGDRARPRPWCRPLCSRDSARCPLLGRRGAATPTLGHERRALLLFAKGEKEVLLKKKNVLEIYAGPTGYFFLFPFSLTLLSQDQE